MKKLLTVCLLAFAAAGATGCRSAAEGVKPKLMWLDCSANWVRFSYPDSIRYYVNKCREAGNEEIILCERGTAFGYHELSVDFRSFPVMRGLGFPVMFDATHSVQKPGGQGDRSGGDRSFVLPLIRAAVAVGIDALFMEVHPDPDSAKCDGPNMVPLRSMREVLRQTSEIDRIVKEKIGFASLDWAGE